MINTGSSVKERLAALQQTSKVSQPKDSVVSPNLIPLAKRKEDWIKSNKNQEKVIESPESRKVEILSEKSDNKDFCAKEEKNIKNNEKTKTDEVIKNYEKSFDPEDLKKAPLDTTKESVKLVFDNPLIPEEKKLESNEIFEDSDEENKTVLVELSKPIRKRPVKKLNLDFE